jgi:hypothetical protein
VRQVAWYRLVLCARSAAMNTLRRRCTAVAPVFTAATSPPTASYFYTTSINGLRAVTTDPAGRSAFPRAIITAGRSAFPSHQTCPTPSTAHTIPGPAAPPALSAATAPPLHTPPIPLQVTTTLPLHTICLHPR